HGGTEAPAVQRSESEGPARALRVLEVRQADHARRQTEAHSRDRAESHGAHEDCGRDVPRVLRPEDGREEADRRQARARRAASRFRLAERRTGLSFLGLTPRPRRAWGSSFTAARVTA